MEQYSGSKIESVHSFTVMPMDCNFNTNYNGKNDIVFGGNIMYHMDFAGAKVARRATYGIGHDMIVTASTDTINFTSPAYLGDIITMVATVKALGRTSIQIRIKVSRESMIGEVESICSANMVFVTMKDGKPFPHGLNFDKLQTNGN
jgi:acyl-CoA hydrolase